MYCLITRPYLMIILSAIKSVDFFILSISLKLIGTFTVDNCGSSVDALREMQIEVFYLFPLHRNRRGTQPWALHRRQSRGRATLQLTLYNFINSLQFTMKKLSN